MTKELFITWIKHFVAHACRHSNARTLLILDGHSTHIKNIEAIDFARDTNLDILCLPPHTSHKLQPLDVSFMNPLKRYCNDEITRIVRVRQFVSLRDLSTVFSAGYIRACNTLTAASGFRRTGIYSLDDVFGSAVFEPSFINNIEIENDESGQL